MNSPLRRPTIDGEERAELARQALAGYENGPDAPIRATNLALEKIAGSETIILVEGISDQVAVETLAARRGRDLSVDGVVVLPVGGVHAALGFLKTFGPAGQQRHLVGLCDADGVETMRRALAEAGVGRPETTGDMARLGFYVCVRDLEDELIRAAGAEAVEAVIDSQGDLGSFRRLQKQPEWRGRPTTDQLHRFFGSKARRGQRYARLLMEAVDLDRVPAPLDGVLDHV